MRSFLELIEKPSELHCQVQPLSVPRDDASAMTLSTRVAAQWGCPKGSMEPLRKSLLLAARSDR